MTAPDRIHSVTPADSRGWIALGCFVLVLIVLAMIKVDPELLENNAFLILATAIIITGWVNGPVGWAYQATKGGGEAAESSARIAEVAAGVPAQPSPDAPAGTEAEPLIVAGAPEGHRPVSTKGAKA